MAFRPGLVRLALLVSGCVLLAAAGAARADAGVLACTHGGDGEHATFEVFDVHSASLRGKVGDVGFHCTLRVDHIAVCGPSCHVPLDFVVHTRLHAERCSVEDAGWASRELDPRPALRVSPSGSHLSWREGRRSPCTALRIDPAFARIYGVEGRDARDEPSDLAPYVGLYPTQAVGGITFLEHPLLKAAVAQAVDDPLVLERIHDPFGPRSPIERRGGYLVSSGCRAHACIRHSWTVYVTPDGQDAEVCHFEAGDGGALWYRRGAAPQRRDGGCAFDG